MLLKNLAESLCKHIEYYTRLKTAQKYQFMLPYDNKAVFALLFRILLLFKYHFSYIMVLHAACGGMCC